MQAATEYSPEAGFLSTQGWAASPDLIPEEKTGQGKEERSALLRELEAGEGLGGVLYSMDA